MDLTEQYAEIEAELKSSLDRVMQGAQFILGPEVTKFEQDFAAYVGTADAVGVGSGTSGLHLALLTAGVGPGDEVITVAHTFTATAEAIVHVGARPVFVDVEPQTCTMSPQAMREAITSRTRAVIPVHLYGHPARLPEIMAIAEEHDLAVIEDAAQAHGAAIEGRRCGSMGSLGCFSFYPGKNLGAFGDAGAVVGSDPEMMAKVRLARDHGRQEKYVHKEVGWCERLDELQAAILNVKLARLEAWTRSRIAHAETYRRHLSGVPGIVLPETLDGYRHVYHLFVVRVEQRDRVLRNLREAGVMAGVHYPLPLHRQPAYDGVARVSGEMSVTESLANGVLSLPMYPELKGDQIAFVCKALKAAVMEEAPI